MLFKVVKVNNQINQQWEIMMQTKYIFSFHEMVIEEREMTLIKVYNTTRTHL